MILLPILSVERNGLHFSRFAVVGDRTCRRALRVLSHSLGHRDRVSTSWLAPSSNRLNQETTMIENTILKANRAGRKALVFSMTYKDLWAVEAAAQAGFDAISLDGEHGAFSAS